MPAKKPHAAQYRALTGISYPTSADALRRLDAGERVPWEERAVREVAAGEVVDDIPAMSLGWLLEQGYIERWPPHNDEVATEEVPGE